MQKGFVEKPLIPEAEGWISKAASKRRARAPSQPGVATGSSSLRPPKANIIIKKGKKNTHHGQLEPLLVTTSKSAWRFKGQPFPGRQLHAQAPRVLPTPGWDEDESPAGWAAESFLPDVGKDTGSSSG